MISALIVAPILIGLGLHALPRRAEAAAKWIGVAVAALAFVVAAVSAGRPDETLRWLQRPFVTNFHVGLGGGLAYWLALLLALVTLCALLVTRVPRQRDFIAQMLLLLGSMMGVFLARDLLLFALFWDLMLIPVFLIMIGWVADKKTASAWRYLVYNLTGGVALLLATAAFGVVEGTTDVIGHSVGGTLPALGSVWGGWIFGGFAFAFLIKTPVWPFHTWMPPTYADLPAPVVAVVSAVQSKAGLYGFLVIGARLLPGPMHAAAPFVMVLGIIALLYGAFAALVQNDAKRVVAYSSLSHLGLIVLAVFSFNPIAFGGAAVYIIAHGLFSGGLFLVLGAIERREETRSLVRLGGLGGRNPKLAGGLAIVAYAALGLPGLCGFTGEIMILTGLYRAGFVWQAAVALVPIVLAAAYMLRLFQGFMHGPEVPDLPQREDMTTLEMLALAPLVVAIVLLGLNPAPVARVPASVAQHRAPAVSLAAPEAVRAR